MLPFRTRMTLLLALVAALSLSCRDDAKRADAPTPLSADAVRQIVREEIRIAVTERDAAQPPECTPAMAFARARPAVVRVEMRRPGTAIITSQGTGFVALAGGVVVTAAHVVRPGDDIRLTLMDGREVAATLIAQDQSADLAIMRAADPKLTPLRWADAAAIAPGERTVVIGYALGSRQPIVTAGILSRRLTAMENAGVERLETDAAADPGNSGGPLLTLCGEALGVVTSIARSTVSTTIATGAATALPFVTRTP